MAAMKFGVGQPVRRVEDDRLVRGAGRYTSDFAPEGALFAHFVRSPHAHARFAVGGLEAARAAPGVKAVLVASDVSHLGDLPCLAPVKNSDGTQTPLKPYPVMAKDEAHHVGDIVAMIVADTGLAAKDAAEALAIDWEALPAVAGSLDALRPDASRSFPARRATSPSTPITATRRKPTKPSPRPRMSSRSGSSIRGWWRTSWSRAERSRRSTPKPAG